MTSELFSARENTGVSETIEYMCAKEKEWRESRVL